MTPTQPTLTADDPTADWIQKVSRAAAIEICDGVKNETRGVKFDNGYHPGYVPIAGVIARHLQAAPPPDAAEVERLPCGHPAELLNKSVESDYQFCELCEARDRKRDAENNERALVAERFELQARIADLESTLTTYRARCTCGCVPGEGSETAEDAIPIEGLPMVARRTPVIGRDTKNGWYFYSGAPAKYLRDDGAWHPNCPTYHPSREAAVAFIRELAAKEVQPPAVPAETPTVRCFQGGDTIWACIGSEATVAFNCQAKVRTGSIYLLDHWSKCVAAHVLTIPAARLALASANWPEGLAEFDRLTGTKESVS